MNKNKGYGLLVVVVVIALFMAVVVGLVMVNAKREFKNINESTRQEELVDNKNQNEAVDYEDDNTEISSDVSTNNTLNGIEEDIEGTKILKEDFSDL